MEVPGSGKPDYFYACRTITSPLVVLKRGARILVFKSDRMSYTFMKTGCELSIIEKLIGDEEPHQLVDPRNEERFINYYKINEDSYQSLIGRQPARESCEFLEIVSAIDSYQSLIGRIIFIYIREASILCDTAVIVSFTCSLVT